MTLEEKAKLFRENLVYSTTRYIGNENYEYIEQAFLAGLKAGRPQWHDLRKDKNDLPNGHKVVLNQAGMATQYDPNRGFLGFGGAGIIAWCKIPTFNKE